MFGICPSAEFATIPALDVHPQRDRSVKIRSRLLTRLAAWLAVRLLRLIFATCRVEARAHPGTNCYGETGEDRFLYCVWHDQIAMTVFSGRPRSMAGLVSRHQDGSYLADAMQMLGIEPVRGSTKRGGTQALRQLIDKTRDLHVAITPDGPRGPRRQMKSGIVFLASHTGRPIVPAAYSARRTWRIQGNWTDLKLPRPFTTIYALGGEPIEVPPDLDRAGIEHYTQLVQAEMERLQQEAARLAGQVPKVDQDQMKAAA